MKFNGNGVSIARNLVWILVTILSLVTFFVTTYADVKTLKDTVKERKTVVEENKKSNVESSQNREYIKEMKQDIKDIKKGNIDVLIGIAELKTIVRQNNRGR